MLLAHQGYKKVYKLKGGVQHYGNVLAAEGVPHWKGQLFVFDRRNTLPLGEVRRELQAQYYRSVVRSEG